MRILPWCKASCTLAINSFESLATVSAQGIPLATSEAKLGPERTAVLIPRLFAEERLNSRAITWCGIKEVFGSKPLHNQTQFLGIC